jgi:hypothetical protein
MSGESKGEKDHGKSVELTKILPECSACVGSVDIRVNSLPSVVPARFGPKTPARARLEGAQAFTIPGPGQSPE